MSFRILDIQRAASTEFTAQKRIDKELLRGDKAGLGHDMLLDPPYLPLSHSKPLRKFLIA